MTDAAIRALADALRAAGSPLSAEELHASCPDLERDLVYATLWSNPLLFACQHDYKWTLASQCSRQVGRHARFDVMTEPRTEPPATAVVQHDGLALRVKAAHLDSVSAFVVTFAGNVVELTLNRGHALYRGRALPFQGDVATAAMEVLLLAWALEEATVPSNRLREGMADIRYSLGKRIQDLTRAL